MFESTFPVLKPSARGRLALAAFVVLAVGAAASYTAHAQAEPSERVSFNEHIRPIFAKHCVACHGGVKQASGLSLIYREQATADCESGLAPIVPGSAEESYLIDRVSDSDPDMRMPPGDHGPALTAEQIALLTRWIDEGTEWELPWSLTPPEAPPLPSVAREHWPRDPLDGFVLARLEAEGLAPAAEAARAAWLRRVTLDLTGLPPSADEYAAFELDNRADAHQRVVDRLLASPHFGERWAAMWLDLARYADTVGYERDPHREIWPYRDWVIRALNDDLPFDEFTVKQLAGDLLPEATLGDRLATAFHRNTQTNTEGGTDDEEFRTVALLDRVSTTWQAWLGTTFQCTQCHAHPYDPFRHEEFYKFVAFFNTSRDADLNEDQPRLHVPDDLGAWDEAQRMDARISAIRHELFAQQAALSTDESLWKGLACASAEADSKARLQIAADGAEGGDEVLADGTVALGSTFTYEFPLDGLARLAAVRIGALPVDEAEAIKTPAAGFVVSQLKAHLISPAGEPLAELKFAAAGCDEAAPLMDPEDSLRDNVEGWGEYTRMSYPRSATFMLAAPQEFPPGARLRLSLKFDHSDSGGGALYLQRAKFAASASRGFAEWLRDDRTRQLNEELAALVKQRSEIPSTNVPIMKEQAAPFARRTFVFERGNWLDKQAEVEPGVPAVMPPLESGAKADRLAMARWVASPANPLTARVMVNRLWQELFGVGIVETAGDFGTSGALPSHPELLDHLAVRFQGEYGWSIKRFLRAVVLSATYRQDASASAESIANDPRNRLLSRGPRSRLTAEMIRDQALVLSGRFSAKMFGRPVMPPQPEGVWRSVYNNQQWKTAEGEDRYRRAVYTYWKRTSGYPSLMTFDAPSRDVCVARRIATNTPLQALVTLNDPAFVELAQGFAERMEATAPTPREQIAGGYQAALGRSIHRAKLAALLQLYEEAATAFDAQTDGAKQLADTRERYGLTIVANALLNLDELLTK